jgi:hypothetical protein
MDASPELGIKETKEFLVGSIRLGKFVVERAKDGIDWSDGTALVTKLTTDEAFRNGLIEAVKDVQKAPAELKDLSFDEGIELAMVTIGELKA